MPATEPEVRLQQDHAGRLLSLQAALGTPRRADLRRWRTTGCGTWRKLEEANRGIHRKVEALGGLSDDELSRALYGGEDDYQHS